MRAAALEFSSVEIERNLSPLANLERQDNGESSDPRVYSGPG
jgi:hypothetical protein